MKVAIYSALLLLVIGVSHVSSQQCHGREMDLCMATIMFHFQSNGVPDDDEKVTEWCETGQEVQECASNYTVKCMTPMQRELIQLFVGGGAAAEKEFCTPGSELRTTYLKHGSCLAEAAESDAFKVIVKDAQTALEATFDADFKDRLPTLCCGFQRFYRGSEDNTRKMCGEGAVEMLDFITNMIVTDLPKTICQSFQAEGETCKNLLPPSGTKPKGAESPHQIAKLLDTLFSSL